MKEKEMIIIDEQGQERLCTILFTHEIDTRQYVVFEVNDSLEISAAEYIPNPNKPEEGSFKAIEDEMVWEALENVLSENE